MGTHIVITDEKDFCFGLRIPKNPLSGCKEEVEFLD
jgi:hypothetical protein